MLTISISFQFDLKWPFHPEIHTDLCTFLFTLLLRVFFLQKLIVTHFAFCFSQVSSTIFPVLTKLPSMSLAHAQHLQRVCYFSHQSSCLKTPTTTGVAVQRLCSLKAAVKSPCWMAIVHPILPSPLRPQKPVLVRVRNSIATCTLPQVDRTLIGTGICRKERACEQAWLACCLFRPCSRQEKFLSLWRKCRRYDRLRDHSTCNSIKESNLSTMHLNPQKAVFMACVFHPTRRAQRVLGSIHQLTHYSPM